MEIYTDGQTVTRTVPFDLEVEQSLLGAVLLSPDKFIDVVDIVTSSNFFFIEKNKKIFATMFDIFQAGETIDTTLLVHRLRDKGEMDIVGGDDYITSLIEKTSTTVNAVKYAEIIKEKFTRRKLIGASQRVAELGYDSGKTIQEVINLSEREIYQVTETAEKINYEGIDQLIPGIVQDIINASEDSKSHRGVTTGFSSLNNKLSGFHNSDLVILAARPSVGKTALALDMARKMAKEENVKIGIFSLEMSKNQLIERILSAETKLDAWKVRTGKVKDDFTVLTDAADKLSKMEVYVDDRAGLSTINIRTTARRMKKAHHIDILFIDYLQLIQPYDTKRSDSMVNHITEVSRTLKQVARELNIPVVALSQLSRDVEKRGGAPRLSDLRDSGSIEQDADVVMFLHKRKQEDLNSNDPIEIEINIAKHRNGPTGYVKLLFDKRYASFNEIASGSYENAEEATLEEF